MVTCTGPGPAHFNCISFATLNIRSASSVTDDLNKPAVLQDFILEKSLDVLSLTETWLSPDTPSSVINSLTPSNYSILHKPRLTGRGGGIALIYRSYMNMKEINIPPALRLNLFVPAFLLLLKVLLFLLFIVLRLCLPLISLSNFLTYLLIFARGRHNYL